MDFHGLDLNQLVQSVAALVEHQLRAHRIRLSLNLAPDLPEIAGSSPELQQVILNLILNAVEAMPDGGDVTIASSANERRVELLVEDHGHGIEPDRLSEVFEPFASSRVSGTGLGLYLTKNVVQMHQGTISAESLNSNGTRFTVRLPLA